MALSGLFSYGVFLLLVPTLFSVAMVAFIWGAFMYVIAGSTDEEMQEKGKVVMLYGLLAFVFMVFVWGILQVIAGVVL